MLASALRMVLIDYFERKQNQMNFELNKNLNNQKFLILNRKYMLFCNLVVKYFIIAYEIISLWINLIIL